MPRSAPGTASRQPMLSTSSHAWQAAGAELAGRLPWLPGVQVVAAGRRKFFYHLDLAGGSVERVAGLFGREDKSLESFVASHDMDRPGACLGIVCAGAQNGLCRGCVRRWSPGHVCMGWGPGWLGHIQGCISRRSVEERVPWACWGRGATAAWVMAVVPCPSLICNPVAGVILVVHACSCGLLRQRGRHPAGLAQVAAVHRQPQDEWHGEGGDRGAGWRWQ